MATHLISEIWEDAQDGIFHLMTHLPRHGNKLPDAQKMLASCYKSDR